MLWDKLRILTCQGGLQGCFRGLVSLRMLNFQAVLQGEVSQWHGLKANTKIPRVGSGNEPIQPSARPPQEPPLEGTPVLLEVKFGKMVVGPIHRLR